MPQICERALLGGRGEPAVFEAAAHTPAAQEPTAPFPDADVLYDVPSQKYHNSRLNAANVWCIDVSPAHVADASATFERCDLRVAHNRLDITKKSSREQVVCADGERFFAHHAGWNSDVSWISCDDQATHSAFLSLFERIGLAQKFSSIVGDAGGQVHMFTAFFVVRTTCNQADMHEDYGRRARTHARMHALTALIPLYKEYADVPDFQLLYRDADQCTRQYRYKHGEAIVFGTGFVHSTEPGRAGFEPTCGECRAHDAMAAASVYAEASGFGGIALGSEIAGMAVGPSAEEEVERVEEKGEEAVADGRTPRAHAYLCFTFGSDLAEHWPAIAETIDGNQSRLISRSAQADGGSMVSLSKLGRRMESGTADDEEEPKAKAVRRLGRTRPRGMLK